jgi:hypothetical protein
MGCPQRHIDTILFISRTIAMIAFYTIILGYLYSHGIERLRVERLEALADPILQCRSVACPEEGDTINR